LSHELFPQLSLVGEKATNIPAWCFQRIFDTNLDNKKDTKQRKKYESFSWSNFHVTLL